MRCCNSVFGCTADGWQGGTRWHVLLQYTLVPGAGSRTTLLEHGNIDKGADCMVYPSPVDSCCPVAN